MILQFVQKKNSNTTIFQKKKILEKRQTTLSSGFYFPACGCFA